MQSPKAEKTRHTTVVPPEDRILIERREIVGEIILGDDFGTPAIVAAFAQAGAYLDDRSSIRSDLPVTVQFRYLNRVFVASMHDTEPLNDK